MFAKLKTASTSCHSCPSPSWFFFVLQQSLVFTHLKKNLREPLPGILCNLLKPKIFYVEEVQHSSKNVSLPPLSKNNVDTSVPQCLISDRIPQAAQQCEPLIHVEWRFLNKRITWQKQSFPLPDKGGLRSSQIIRNLHNLPTFLLFFSTFFVLPPFLQLDAV